jgi:hypothetical protein
VATGFWIAGWRGWHGHLPAIACSPRSLSRHPGWPIFSVVACVSFTLWAGMLWSGYFRLNSGTLTEDHGSAFMVSAHLSQVLLCSLGVVD